MNTQDADVKLYYHFNHDRKPLARGFRYMTSRNGKVKFSSLILTWHYKKGNIAEKFKDAEDVKATLPDCNNFGSSPKPPAISHLQTPLEN